MGALVGLGFGLGCVLVIAAFTLPPLAARTSPRTAVLSRQLAEAGMGQVQAGSVRALAVICALVAFVVVLAITAAVPVALVFGLLGGWAPFAVIGVRAKARLREFAQVWPDAVDNLASGVRAGLSLPEALSALASTGPVPLREPFAGFALDYQLSGRFSDALDRLKENLADPVGDRVIEGVRVAREVGGGDLGRVLRNLSRFLRDDLHTRSELESRQAWVVNGARLAVAAPWVVLLLMGLQGNSLAVYSTPAGAVVLACGAGACVLAYRLMVRIGRLPSEARVLG